MPSDLQVSNIKDLTGSNTGLSIASDGQVTISQNNPTIQLGSNATINSTAWQSQIKSTAWFLNTNIYGSNNPLGGTTSNWTLVDQSESNVPVLVSSISVNNLISQTNGVWSFSTTGYYLITYQFLVIGDTSASLYNDVHLWTSSNNGTNFYRATSVGTSLYATGAQGSVFGTQMLKITDTSNDKFKLSTGFQGGGNVYVYGTTDPRYSVVRAIRLSGI